MHHHIITPNISKVLRYPLCSQKVLVAIQNLLKDSLPCRTSIQLPRRLFKFLQKKDTSWTDADHPIPFLRSIMAIPARHQPYMDSNLGYALTKAVHAKFVPLIQILLENGANPQCHNSLAVKVAIKQKDLALLKLLVERTPTRPKAGKKPKMQDRVKLDPAMLKLAVLSQAKDIVQYMYREKGVIPDMETLKKIQI
ncbi:hypothetical protein CVT24_000370 [Panaeolus cyanescens]|uniref:Uncharacterized protein n=1 Tax=Panaeolus cyanescens TaxID=181874 RepID=A0A409YD01_9AGAR|nr:hypothetical protein CVT24_000370 [Panaeolus cyanescens]